MWSMRGHGENWRLKRGSFRDMVCWEEEVGSQSRSGGDVMMLRFIVHMFEVQLWRLQHLEVEKPGCGVRGGMGGWEVATIQGDAGGRLSRLQSWGEPISPDASMSFCIQAAPIQTLQEPGPGSG